MFYFDWKQINEINESRRIQFIPLIVGAEGDYWLAICHLIKINKTLYSSLVVFGFTGILFRKGMSYRERFEAMSALLAHIGKEFASRCSSFTIREERNSLNQKPGEFDNILLEHGFQVRPTGTPGFPCSHILALEPPFEINIRQRLWSQKLRHALNRVERRGVKVIQDREFKYLDIFLDMSAANYARHGAAPVDRKRMTAEMNIFKDKTRLFVALDDGLPVAIQLCHYTPSTCALWEAGSFTKGTDDANKYCYQSAIEDACNNGYKYAHFGGSYTEGLAQFKDAFKAVRVPIILYERRYSSVRKMGERAQLAVEFMLSAAGMTVRNPAYAWDKGKILWRRVIRK